mmetsp:Transcript_24174/g.37168  ORF Transcript_24174/g.37168 Transcript_24174/m.37168 type:complete len:311 (+) Transcript_24174:3485-4417(+)
MCSNESEYLNMYSRHSSITPLHTNKAEVTPDRRSREEVTGYEEEKGQHLTSCDHRLNLTSESVNTSKKSLNSKSSRSGNRPKLTNFAARTLSDDRWTCPICLDIYRNAVETPCCHNLFCEECIKQTPSCPLCKRRIEGQLHPNIPIRRLVNDLSVTCSNEGCSKVVKIGDIDRHLEACKYTLVDCPNSSECGLIPRKNLEDHKANECAFRLVNCIMDCGVSLPLIQVDDHIRETCVNYEIYCRNNCGKSVKRGRMDEHLGTTCPLEVIECPNKGESLFEEGCTLKLKRREMEHHKNVCSFKRVHCMNHGC